MDRYSSDPRERAQQLVAEGRLGGAHYGRLGGRPRKPRASEIVAEEAAEHAEEMVQALRDALDPSQPVAVRLRAAKDWLAIERREAGLQLQEDERVENMAKDELVAMLIGRMTAGPIRMLLADGLCKEEALVSERAAEAESSRGELGLG